MLYTCNNIDNSDTPLIESPVLVTVTICVTLVYQEAAFDQLEECNPVMFEGVLCHTLCAAAAYGSATCIANSYCLHCAAVVHLCEPFM
jgi:hypothetical protein